MKKPARSRRVKRAARPRRTVPAAFRKYAKALKLTKGKSCGSEGRKAVVRAVRDGASPADAVDTYCPR